jgi:hypothetical protein
MDICDGLPGLVLKSRQAARLVRIGYVYQVMHNLLALFWSWLGGANVHPSIKKAGISRNDLAIQAFGYLDGDFSFSHSRGADDNHKRWARIGGHQASPVKMFSK